MFEVAISKIVYDMAISNIKVPLNAKGTIIFPLAYRSLIFYWVLIIMKTIYLPVTIFPLVNGKL